MKVPLRKKSVAVTVLIRPAVALLRHPLTIVLVTTAVTSFVVPMLTRNSDLRQQRLSRALDLFERNMEVNRRLNSLLTTLELFHKDNSGAAARLSDYRQEQRELRKVMMVRYAEFDNVAWWWYGRVSTEAGVLGLTSALESDRVRALAREYEQSLIQSTEVLNNLWTTFLREEYDPSDAGNTVLMNDTRKKLGDLQGVRERSIQALAELLASK